MKYIISVWVGILLFISGALVMQAFEQPKKTQAETIIKPTNSPTNTPIPTEIPTPTVDIQLIQEQAALNVRLNYLNTIIPEYQQKYNLANYVAQQMSNNLLNNNEMNGFYVNPAPLEASVDQQIEETETIKQQLDQLIEERNEIQAELGQN